MIELDLRRRFFADEIAAVANLRTPALVDALAAVPREQFLPQGPWQVMGEGAVLGGARQTPDADPQHVYHNYSVAIDAGRMLFNGAPGLIAGTIDALNLHPGSRVLHIGAGLGYYSALIGHVVGSSGRTLALEIDPALAAAARANVHSMPWVEVRESDGRAVSEPFDAIFVSAGVTHPEESWLESLVDNGRLILPLTATIEAMGPIGKGVMVLVTRAGKREWTARVLTFVAIYSAAGLRDDALNAQLGAALMQTPFPRLKQLRRDRHDREQACWLHGQHFCLSVA
jgi:protein-L-isoaspartate(D-aspartate) O-methyltransferase